VVSDGFEARIGTLTAGPEWFKPWRTASGENVDDVGVPKIQVLLRGGFEPKLFREHVRDCNDFEVGRGGTHKNMAGYHQFHAVRVAVEETLRATGLASGASSGRKPGGAPGDRRIGVVWHTQGSGKSLTMVFYARRISREPLMANPTIVVLTDRNDL